jgi:hypothetical protein
MIKEPTPRAMNSPAKDELFSASKLILFMLFNILLAYLSKQSGIFSTIYGISVLILGIFYLLADKNPIRVIYICGYLVGAELIWRLSDAGIFWEYGKYAISFLLLLSLIKFNLLSQAVKWPILYFVLLLPSVFLLPFFDRQAISSWLSGPFLLAVSTLFFSSLSLTKGQIKKTLIMIIGPTIGIAFLALSSIFSTTNLIFRTQTNFTAAGGAVPVQVSMQLAFGSILAFYYAITEKQARWMVILMFGLGIWLISQSIFTFSRSGFYTAGVALFFFFAFFIKQRKQRLRSVLIGTAAVLFIIYIGFPYMDQFTAGILAARYQEIGTSGRELFMIADIQAFLANPMFGIGPGQSIQYHIHGSAHTEYTRMLAEHGVLGLFSVLILFFLVAKRIWAKTSTDVKSFQILMTVYALAYMLSITLRTASPGFAFGLGAVVFLTDEVVERTPENSAGGQISLWKR